MRCFIQAKGIVLLIAALVLLGVAGCNSEPDPIVWTINRPPSDKGK